MFEWLQGILGLPPQKQVEVIAQNEPTVEERLERLLRNLGHYGKKQANDLEEIIRDLNIIIDIVEKIIITLESIGGAERARDLRKKLRNHRTRAQNARFAKTKVVA